MPHPRKRILYVDHYPEICEMIRDALTDFEVATAYTMAGGLERAKEERFDIVVIEHYLSDGTGLDLCCHIRDFNQQIPILLCSIYKSITEQEALAAGAQGLIKKFPYFVQDLEQSILRLLAPT